MRSVKAWSAWHNDFAYRQISYANGKDCEDHYVIPYRYYFINNGIYDRRKIIKDGVVSILMTFFVQVFMNHIFVF